MTNIILCGGNGTRLWPISRSFMPKQFVKLFIEESTEHKNNKSLFQLTVERNSKACNSQLIVSNTEQYFLALDQLEEINQINNSYLLEPIGRNTAPAITLACMSLDEDEIVLVTPSDHLIKNEIAYEKVMEKAQKLASKNNLVTFGIKPTSAETGFGYIESINEFDVKAFHEKPDFDTALRYFLAGNYYWNSGMFMFKAGIFLEELQKYSPEIYKTSVQAFSNATKDNLIRIKYEDMVKIPEDSIDYAVMEKSTKIKVVPSDINWSDVGSFDALAEELPNDENNNLIISNRAIELIDIENIIVVDADDALLICKKGSSQKVKDIVSKLKKDNIELTNIHQTGYRPWGTYTVLEDSLGYKIKRIEVKPNCRLSLQSHKYRNEHWIVVSGVATITLEDKVFKLKENESTYIKAGDKHRLANETTAPLIIIEAQVGKYTGEDDIIRYDDDFLRDING